jgi:hypothetical protein
MMPNFKGQSTSYFGRHLKFFSTDRQFGPSRVPQTRNYLKIHWLFWTRIIGFYCGIANMGKFVFPWEWRLYVKSLQLSMWSSLKASCYPNHSIQFNIISLYFYIWIRIWREIFFDSGTTVFEYSDYQKGVHRILKYSSLHHK